MNLLAVRIVTVLLIVVAFLCLPLYVLWIAAGAIADKIERRRLGR